MTAPRTAAARASHGRKWTFITLATGAAIGAVVGLLSAIGVRPTAWLATGIAAIVVVVAFWVAWKWWLAIDEAAREAHKTGWYWGGTAGLLVAMVLFTGLLFADPAIPLDRYAMAAGDAGLIVTGIMVTAALQLAGYGVVWSGWWLLRGR